MTDSTDTTDTVGALRSALDGAVAAGVAAGLTEADARDEARRLAAAVSESAVGAGPVWLAAVGDAGGVGSAGGAGGSLDEFFTAAASARRWRNAPTDLLVGLVDAGAVDAARPYARALVEVVAAAASIGEPTMGVIAAASATSAAQLGALPVADAGRGALDASIPSPAGPQARGFDASAHSASGAGPTSATDRSATGAAGAAGATADVPAADAEPPKSLDELLAELDALIGLDSVKAEIHRQTQLLRVDKLRTAAGLRTPTLTRHLVFLGNPGTGKTTVARLVSGIYRALGILAKGHLVEVDRSELVAGYLGQTASKTSDVIASARGGVLFIDEAYGLALDQYGAEAITTIVKDMEDHRGDLVVIVAGYPEPMAGFMETNPGLASRFSTNIEFDDYTADELRRIFVLHAGRSDFDPTPDALERFDAVVAAAPRGEGFGNGRYARNLLDAAIARHAWRLRDVSEPTLEQLRQLVADDIADDIADGAESEQALVAPDGAPAVPTIAASVLPSADAPSDDHDETVVVGAEGEPAHPDAPTGTRTGETT